MSLQKLPIRWENFNSEATDMKLKLPHYSYTLEVIRETKVQDENYWKDLQIIKEIIRKSSSFTLA